MPLYYYESFSRAGKKVTGTIDAPSPQGAKDMLQGQGLMPTNIEPAAHRSGGFSLGGLFRKKVDQKTIIVFTKQLSVLLRSGVPLVQSLEMLIEQFEAPFSNMLMTITEGVKGGSALADQLEPYPDVFSNVYVQLVRAGEASGKLEVILERQVAYMQRSMETAQEVSKALRQPIFMLGFIGFILAAVLGYIVPRMSDIFLKTGKELPAMTQFMVSASDFLTGNYLYIIFGLILFIIGFNRWKSTESGGYTLDSWKLKLPLISYFSKTKAVVQFCQTLGMLMESGVNLSEALDIVANIVENRVLAQKLREARDNIIKEGKIARYLKETGLFPKMASYMIATGEESGKLAEMLTTVGKDYDAELIEITETLTAAIDPVMKITIGGIVFLIVLAIFLPIMQMGELAGI
jgi:type II secretory pathway component PulF